MLSLQYNQHYQKTIMFYRGFFKPRFFAYHWSINLTFRNVVPITGYKHHTAGAISASQETGAHWQIFIQSTPDPRLFLFRIWLSIYYRVEIYFCSITTLFERGCRPRSFFISGFAVIFTLLIEEMPGLVF